MVRLATGDSTGKESNTITPHVISKLVEASPEYRKRPRSSLEYRNTRGESSDLVHPPLPKQQAKDRTQPQQQAQASPSRGRGTGIPPTSASNRYYSEEGSGSVTQEEVLEEMDRQGQRKRKRSSNKRQKPTVAHGQLLEDLKKDGVPVFQWVILLGLVLLGAWQLWKAVAVPSAQDPHYARRKKAINVAKKSKKQKSSNKSKPQLDDSALEALIKEVDGEDATASTTTRTAKKSSKQKPKKKQKSKASATTKPAKNTIEDDKQAQQKKTESSPVTKTDENANDNVANLSIVKTTGNDSKLSKDTAVIADTKSGSVAASSGSRGPMNGTKDNSSNHDDLNGFSAVSKKKKKKNGRNIRVDATSSNGSNVLTDADAKFAQDLQNEEMLAATAGATASDSSFPEDEWAEVTSSKKKRSSNLKKETTNN